MPSGIYGHKPCSEKTKKKISNKLKGCKIPAEVIKKRSATYLKNNHRGCNNHSWKGGIWKHHTGYVYVYSPEHPFRDKDNYVKRSRLVMESIVNRFLKRTEVVHHINGIKDDDRPENLRLFENDSDHQRFHVQEGTHAFNRINQEG